MNIYKVNLLVMATFIFVCGEIVCLAASNNSQSSNNQTGTITKDSNSISPIIRGYIETLTKNTNENERSQAVAALRQIGDTSATEALAQALLNDPSNQVRTSCIYAQIEICTKEVSEL